MIKKSLKSKTSKSHTWAPLSSVLIYVLGQQNSIFSCIGKHGDYQMGLSFREKRNTVLPVVERFPAKIASVKRNL
jgi:hypothetical protein